MSVVAVATSIIPFTLINLVVFVSCEAFNELFCSAVHVQRAGVADVFESFVALVQNSNQGSLINHSALQCESI